LNRKNFILGTLCILNFVRQCSEGDGASEELLLSSVSIQ